MAGFEFCNGHCSPVHAVVDQSPQSLAATVILATATRGLHARDDYMTAKSRVGNELIEVPNASCVEANGIGSKGGVGAWL